MKIKLARKDVNRRYEKVIRAGYCDLQTLLRGIEPIAYNAGIYGWNWDCIELNHDIAIVTGYRNLTGKRLPDNKAVEFENRAKEIDKLNDWRKEEFERKKLISEFIEFIDNNYSNF